MKHICKHCGIEKETSSILSGHSVWCLKNPDIEEHKKNLSLSLRLKTKRIIKICERCHTKFEIYRKIKNEREIITSKERKCCSRKCANTRKYTKEKSKTVYEKVSKTLLTQNISKWTFFFCKICGKQKKTTISKLKKYNKKYCSRKCSYFASKSNRWKHTKESKNKISYLVKEQFRKGRKISGGKTKWLEVNTNRGKIKVQGSYEVRTCHILDEMEKRKEILFWEYTNDRIQYLDKNSKQRSYLFDFKICTVKTIYYIETKGYVKENDLLKWNEAQKQGYVLKVWYKKDLEKQERRLNLSV
ncbi:MAG: hypothetical protein A2W05_04080 [Candidatus Schekmanbacteria bacterium RBG_16_38_10]|uniref:Uncharacterized protein n=1 Tax=Candidatus Schekmanbacteria bacterium RBG_16_38_10 TaxID=1817879 RepID=A0A1F7S0Y6_9BACT|nr:MAG: hypothetical protein A2W05_04080 [Candidatus Schekmanbacteria bacterium RBG_16_38_10]